MQPVVSTNSIEALRLPSVFSSPFVSLSELVDLIADVGLSDNTLVQAALSQAEASHMDHLRPGGMPCLEQHIYAVTKLVIEHQIAAGGPVTAELVAAALNHDVPEDDPTMPIEKYREKFSAFCADSSDGVTNVADIVEPLTKKPYQSFPGEAEADKRAARDAGYFQAIALGRPEVKLCKVADRTNNISTLHRVNNPEEILAYCVETERFILPIADKVAPVMAGSIRDRIKLLRECFTTNAR